MIEDKPRSLLGDFIAGVTDKLGIKKCSACQKRQMLLNKVDLNSTTAHEVGKALLEAITLDTEEEKRKLWLRRNSR